MVSIPVNRWSDGIEKFCLENFPKPVVITAEDLVRVAREAGYLVEEGETDVRLCRMVQETRFKFWKLTRTETVDTILLSFPTRWEQDIDSEGITYHLIIPSYYSNFPLEVRKMLELPTQHRVEYNEPVVFLPYPTWDDREWGECLAFKSEVRHLVSSYISELVTIARECKHGGG